MNGSDETRRDASRRKQKHTRQATRDRPSVIDELVYNTGNLASITSVVFFCCDS